MTWYDGLYETAKKVAWPAAIAVGLAYGFGALRGCSEKERNDLSGRGVSGEYSMVTSGLKVDNPLVQRPKFVDGSKESATLDSQLVEMQKVSCKRN